MNSPTKAKPQAKAATYDYATDAMSGTVRAVSLQVAYDSLRATITNAQIADGATLWVEDTRTGERITMDRDGGAS